MGRVNVLAGDVGGTKTLLALADVEGTRVSLLHERLFPSQEYASFLTLAREFIEATPAGSVPACIGVAGPVVSGRAIVTKLPWDLNEPELARELGLSRMRLINDFAAIARGVEALAPEDLFELHAGKADPDGPVAVLGAGTGLGEAFSVKIAGRRSVLSSEGGHADFAPRDEVQMDLLRYMTKKYERCSYDRILSGPGFWDLYCFFRDSGQEAESNELREAIARERDPAPVVTRFALEKGDPLCLATIDLFCSIYGAEAGNLALRIVATGGVYVAGGIAPRILDRLKAGGFVEAYGKKGRLAPMVQSIPVQVILNSRVGLLGAAVAAADPDPR